MNQLKKQIPNLLIVLGFVIIAFAYCSPVISGKRLNQNDQIQGNSAAQEVLQRFKTTGEWSWWTNSMFSGMPSYLIQSKAENAYLNDVISRVNNILPSPVNLFFFMMLSMFVLLLTLKIDKFIAAMGAIAFAFSSYNVIYIEAGHIAKLIALSFVPLLIAGVIKCYQKKYLSGAALTALAMTAELYANHLQITYYAFFIIIAIGIYYFVESIRTGWYRGFAFGTLFAIVGITIGSLTNTSKVWSNYEYAKETIRGKSDLTPKDNVNQKADGLDKTYAFQYSHGISESLTFFVPNFKGGPSDAELSKKSDTYKTLTSLGVDDQNASMFIQHVPMYAGEQDSAAPQYDGAIICFLFILAMFIVKNRIKWVFFGIAVLFTMLSWGSNFEAFNYLMFDYFPFYNKFRAVNQILILNHFAMVILATLAINEILETKPTFAEIKKPLIYSIGTLFGLWLVGFIMNDLNPAKDKEIVNMFTQQFGNNKQAAEQLMASIVSDRNAGFWSDSLRSWGFVLASLIAIYLFVSTKINKNILGFVLIALVSIDGIMIAKRFLNNKNFVTKASISSISEPSAIDAQILNDKSESYRVYNLTTNPFASAVESNFHKSIGGYHAAKLKRYQELIENHLSKGNMGVLNMLNTKYFIVAGKDNVPMMQENIGALGNAWFVGEVIPVKNADEEMKSLEGFDPRKVAYVDAKFANYIQAGKQTTDTTSRIKLTKYSPDIMEYEYSSKTPQTALFSEIFYRGNQDWKSYIDDQEKPHFRADYVLRGLSVPAGSHKIRFEFKPDSIYKGSKIDLIASILAFILIGVALFFEIRKKEAVV
jgi:hypothetical protein